jgi:hypothetical protein
MILSHEYQNIDNNIFVKLFWNLYDHTTVREKNIESPRKSQSSGNLIANRFFLSKEKKS